MQLSFVESVAKRSIAAVGLGFIGFMVQGLGFRIYLGFSWYFRFGVQGLGFRV